MIPLMIRPHASSFHPADSSVSLPARSSSKRSICRVTPQHHHNHQKSALSSPHSMCLLLALMIVCSSSSLVNAKPVLSTTNELLFIHLTDLHLDPHYTPHSTPSTSCHRPPSSSSNVPENLYGYPHSSCDTPEILVESVLGFINSTFWKDDNDGDKGFILWTGDSSRHDRDDEMKKTELETYEQTRKATTLLKTYFTDSKKIPVIPSLGNWDTFPANQSPCTPNHSTFSRLWSSWSLLFDRSDPEFIQIEKDFLQGGFFSKTLKPNLKVLSLNTLSFFESNDMVKDCSAPSILLLKKKKKSETPGDTQLRFVQSHLQQARDSSSKVIIIGHVPPQTVEDRLYKPNCLQSYTELIGEYADVILNQYFGHINKDLLTLLLQTPKKKYRLLPLSSSSKLNDVDTHREKVVGTLSTSHSVVPVLEPSFRLGRLSTLGEEGRWVLKEQSTYTTLLAEWNKVDKRSEFVETCDSVSVFQVPVWTAAVFNDWIQQLQMQTTGKKGGSGGGLERYLECLEMEGGLESRRYQRVTSELDENWGMDVVGVVGMVVLGVVGLVVVG
ncbi:Endopolyphosphatase, partial [Chytridiales sp. JEL 0842]